MALWRPPGTDENTPRSEIKRRKMGWNKYPQTQQPPSVSPYLQPGPLSEEDYQRFVERLNNGGKPPEEP